MFDNTGEVITNSSKTFIKGNTTFGRQAKIYIISRVRTQDAA